MGKKMWPWVLVAWLGATSLVITGAALAVPGAASIRHGDVTKR